MSTDQGSLANSAETDEEADKRQATVVINLGPGRGFSSNGGVWYHDVRATFQNFIRSHDKFIAGSAAALFNISILFPINKLIFRQIASAHGTFSALRLMQSEGYRYLYRGILPPLIHKSVATSTMFGSFGTYRCFMTEKFSLTSPVVITSVASCMAGTTESVLTPLERVQMLLQHSRYHKNYKNTLDAMIKLKCFGLREYYRGWTCVVLRNGPSNSLFFGFRDKIKNLMPSDNHNRHTSKSSKSTTGPSSATTVSQAMLLSSTALISELQPRSSLPSADLFRPKPISQEHLVKDHPSYLKEPECNSRFENLLPDFLSGGILGALISTLFYPMSVVRIRMQTRAPGTKFLSPLEAFNQVYIERDRKFHRFFHGCFLNAVRQFLSWGITNCGYEIVLETIRRYD